MDNVLCILEGKDFKIRLKSEQNYKDNKAAVRRKSFVGSAYSFLYMNFLIMEDANASVFELFITVSHLESLL